MQIDRLTFEVLKVLSLSNREKLTYLTVDAKQEAVLLPQDRGALAIPEPAECFAALATKVFHQYRGHFYEDKNWPSIRNVWCVLEMALELGRVVDYFWKLSPEKPLTGPLDDVWAVLEFLAIHALHEHDIQPSWPEHSFQELLTSFEQTCRNQ